MFSPVYQITQEITKHLMSIEGNKEAIKTLPVNAKILASLRETAKLMTTHYSTAIEGNRMTGEEVERFIKANLKPKERDELEIVGYYNALEYVREKDVLAEISNVFAKIKLPNEMLEIITENLKKTHDFEQDESNQTKRH